jgi:large subunit ribosomal protein LP2
MKHLAAYLLLGLAGNTSPSAEDIKEVLGAVGIEAEEDRLNLLLKELEGKDINEVWAVMLLLNGNGHWRRMQLISQGTEKLASVPAMGGGAAPAAAAPAAGGAAPAAGGAAPAAEEKEEAKEESEDEDMGFGLFD